MKTLRILAIGTVVLFSAGILDAAPWDRSRFAPSPQRHYGPGVPGPGGSSYHGRGHSFHNRIEVKAQVRLRQLGYYRGPIDGRFGPASRRALIRFQRDSWLPRTARLDHRTIRALRIR